MTTTHSLCRRPLIMSAGLAVVVAAGLLSASPAGAAPSASVANDTLTVTGSSGNDKLVLRVRPATPNVLEVDFGADGTAEFEFDRSTFSKVAVTLASGRDEFSIDRGTVSLADETMTIDGGSGDDNLTGSNAVEVFIGGSGSDFVDGNQGNDTGIMGSGDDTFRWDPGDGSDIVEGASGVDTLDFNGAGVREIMSLSPEDGRAIFLRDVANIRMDMDNVERLDLTALGGNDDVTIDDMSGTDFRQADVDLGGADAQPDVITVNGSASADRIDVDAAGGRVEVDGLQTKVNITGTETIDHLQVNGLGGDDRVSVDDTVLALIDVDVDLGPQN
jgi:Ca2+-binding RTX toxin-like protein